MRKKLWMALGLAAALSLTACGKQAESREVSGKTVAEAENPKQVGNAEKGDGAEASDSVKAAGGKLTPEAYQNYMNRICNAMALAPDGAVYFNKNMREEDGEKLVALELTEGKKIAKLRDCEYFEGNQTIHSAAAVTTDGELYVGGNLVLEECKVADVALYPHLWWPPEEYTDATNGSYMLVAPEMGEIFAYNIEDQIQVPLGISDVEEITLCHLDKSAFFLLKHKDQSYEPLALDEEVNSKIADMDVSCLNGAVQVSGSYDSIHFAPDLSWEERQQQILENYIFVGVKEDGTVVGNQQVPSEVLAWENMARVDFYSHKYGGSEEDTSYDNYGFLGVDREGNLRMEGVFPDLSGEAKQYKRLKLDGLKGILAGKVLSYYTGYESLDENGEYMWYGWSEYTRFRTPEGKNYMFDDGPLVWKEQ